MAENDVPEYLNELIPYRCPKCGHLRRFATLRELRQHLQAEHSFQMGFIKPHARAQVFKGARESTGSSNFARSLSSEERFSGTSSKSDTDPVNEYRRITSEFDGSRKFRDTSPLLKTFKEETELLEKELQQARQNEMKHKAQSMHTLSESSVNTDFKISLESIKRSPESIYRVKQKEKSVGLGNNCQPNVYKDFVEKAKSQPSLQRGHFGSSHDFKSTLDSLNKEVMKSRMNQWVTADALYKSQDLLKDMEAAAEVKCQEQRKIIETLVQEMKTKDAMLESRTKQHVELSSERQRLMDETESIVKETDDYNSRLIHELNDRGKILDGLNKELEKLRTQTQQEIKMKEHDLQHASQKISQLEWERERLIQETDRILKQADDDTGQLRRTLQAKEEELKNVNETLNHLRTQQQSMLEKTMTVYRSSEESRDIMKTAIKTKDSQLQHAMKQIENMSSLHKRLLEQSQILTDQADDNTSSMKRLLQAKGEQIHDLVQQLETLKREKRHLEDSTLSLAEKAESSVSVVESLRDMVRQKESDLKTTQSELHGLKTFLKNAADKERVARHKLETFIEDLIDRAEVAESELRVLKSHSTDTLSANHEGKLESSSDIHPDDSTERKSLPSKLEPFKSGNSTTFGKEKNNKNQEIRSNRITGTSSDRLVIMADIHNVEQTGTSKENKVPILNLSKDAKNTGDIYSPGKDKVTLEASGGFVAQEGIVSCDSRDSDDDMYELKHITDSNEDIQYAEHVLRNEPNPYYTKKKSYDQRDKNSRDFPTDSYEWVDKVQRLEEKGTEREKNNFPMTKSNIAKRRSKHKRNNAKYSVKTVNSGSDVSTDEEMENHSHSEYYPIKQSYEELPLRNGGKQVTRGLQVGQFLSTQEINKTVEDSSEYSPTVSSDDDYVRSENKGHVRRYTQNKKNNSARIIIQADKRPATMGKSHENGNVTKPGDRKKTGRKKRSLNREFDTRFPSTHKSMVNIASDKQDLSEVRPFIKANEKSNNNDDFETCYSGEVVLGNGGRQRRSKSLSPTAFAAGIAYQHEETVESSTDTSCYEEVPIENDHVEGQGDMERTDGVFNNIMDENGILWDDDMATLPDVSDSEFDRVSPSGSEAVATKNTCYTTTVFSQHPGSVRTIGAKYTPNKPEIRSRSDQSITEQMSVSKVARILNEKPSERRLKDRQKIRSSQDKDRNTLGPLKDETNESNIDYTDINEAMSKSTLDKGQTDKIMFRPIKSPPYSKSSASSKDLTSGGQEVKQIMGSSPVTEIVGTSVPETLSRNSSSSYRSVSSRLNDKDQHTFPNKINEAEKYKKVSSPKQVEENSRMITSSSPSVRTSFKNKEENKTFKKNYNEHKYDKETENISDKIERISNKYSPKHESRLTGNENAQHMGLEEKIKSIQSKYREKRDDILKGKGMGQHQFDLSDQSLLRDRSVSNRTSSISVREKGGRKIGNEKYNVPFAATIAPRALEDHQRLTGTLNQGFGYRYPAASYEERIRNGEHFVGYPYMPYQVPFPFPPNWTPQQTYPFQQSYLPSLFHQEQQQQQQPPSALPQQQQQNIQKEKLQQQPQEDKFNVVSKGINKEISTYSETPLDNKTLLDIDNKLPDFKKTSQNREKKPKEVECGHELFKCSIEKVDSQLQRPKTPMLMSESDIETEEVFVSEKKQTSLSLKPQYFTDGVYKRTVQDLHVGTTPSLHVDDWNTPEAKYVQNELDIHDSGTRNELVNKDGFPKTETVKPNDSIENSDAVKSGSAQNIQTIPYVNISDTVKLPVTGFSEAACPDVTAKTIVSNEYVNHSTAENVCHKEPNVKASLGLFEDTDDEDISFSMVNKSSLFAEEIGDETPTEYDSNTQSFLDLPGNGTDTDIDGDTDTESVRRDFYEKTKKIKDLIDGPHNDFADVYRHKLTRNTTSSTSSQASLDIVDRIPLAKREQVKQRRAALVAIFSFLDTRTLSRVAQVCREWRIVSRSPKLWRRVELRGEKVSSQFLRHISRRCSQLRVLILEDLHPRTRNTTESVEDFQKNIKCSLEAGYEQILKKAEATLHTIIITNCGTLLSAKCLWIASCCCRMLKHVTYLSDFDPINAEVMWALGSGCRELKTLKCQPIFPCAKADNFTTRCAQLIGKCFRDLETVSLGGIIVDVSALIFIAKQCSNLRYIELHQMKFIKCDVIDEMCQNGLQFLKSIQFHATPVAPGALMVLQGNCKYLEEVYVQITETDFIAAVGDQDPATQIPEYQEIFDGYEALKNQPSLCKIFLLKAELPTRPQETKETVQERSFFDRLFNR